MAVDNLVDSGKLNACCEAEAAAIIAKGGGAAPLAYDFANNKGFADAIAAIPSGGITPAGNINITDTNVTDVTQYATAQVVDADLIAGNIKEGVNILGILGTFAGGGAEITDGIVVKAVDENGWATEIDVYSSDGIPKFNFTTGGRNQYGWWKLEKVNFKPPFTKIRSVSFSYLSNLKEITGLEELTGSLSDNLNLLETQIEELVLPNFESETAKWVICSSNSALKRAYLPKYKSFSYDGTTTEFSYCTGLETVQIGSIGYHASPSVYTFKGCTQSGLTIIAYTRGINADTVLSNIRNGATNATIIIKASEDTTYSGTSYTAGETMITSEVA